MSALIVNDTGNNAIVDSDGDVRKLQDLVRKLQVQNQMLLGETENQSADAKSENSTCVVDANCNTDIFQCSIPPRTGVLREQQMNSNNTRLMSRTDPEANDDVDSVRAAVSQLSHSLADDSRNTKEQSQNSCLDSVQLIDVDGKLSDDEESWLYKSPEHAEKTLPLQSSPYDWLRTDFDRPSPQLSSARKSLLIKLDQVTKPSSVDVPKMGVHKFDIKRALADIQSVDRGDVTEIISIHPGLHSAGRSTPVLGTVGSRQPGSEVRSSSPRVTITRRASAVDDRPSASSAVRKVDLSKSFEELDGIFASVRAEGSSHIATTLQERDSDRVDGNLDEAMKRTSASEENLLSTGHRLNDVTDIKQLARLQE